MRGDGGAWRMDVACGVSVHGQCGGRRARRHTVSPEWMPPCIDRWLPAGSGQRGTNAPS